MQVSLGRKVGLLEVVDTRNPLNNLSSNSLDEFLTTTVLKSRFVGGIHMPFGCGFSAKWENQAREALSNLPWSIFYRKSASMPEVRVKSRESRLVMPKHVVGLIHEAFSEYKGKSPDFQLENKAWDSRTEFPSPAIVASVEDDVMRLSIDAGGPHLNQIYLEPFTKQSRLRIPQICASAIVSTSLLPIIGSVSLPTVIWDPLCANGVLPLMIAHTLAGFPAGSPASPYPFQQFPTHDPAVFTRIANSLTLQPHPKLGLLSVLGSDSATEGVGISSRNREIFLANMPSTDADDNVQFPVAFQRHPDAYTPPSHGKVIIVTAVPAKGDTDKKYASFHSMVDSLIREKRLMGCVVATSKSHQFRHASTQRWLTELRFFDGRRDVEVLSLVLS